MHEVGVSCGGDVYCEADGDEREYDEVERWCRCLSSSWDLRLDSAEIVVIQEGYRDC